MPALHQTIVQFRCRVNGALKAFKKNPDNHNTTLTGDQWRFGGFGWKEVKGGGGGGDFQKVELLQSLLSLQKVGKKEEFNMADYCI